jgi:hypothetical protein
MLSRIIVTSLYGHKVIPGVHRLVVDFVMINPFGKLSDKIVSMHVTYHVWLASSYVGSLRENNVHTELLTKSSDGPGSRDARQPPQILFGLSVDHL